MPQAVLVPGFMQRGHAWSDVAALLAERYSTVCLDHQSDTLAGRIAEVRSAAERDAVLVGYSLGGRIALHAALDDRAYYGGLVLIGASAGIEDPDERARRREADETLAAWIERSTIGKIAERWERQPIFATQPPALVAAQRPGRLSHEPRRLATLLRECGQGAIESVWDRLGSLDIPVLAIAGALDERYAEEAKRLAAATPAGRHALVDGAGHAPQLERPQAVAELILSR